MRTGIDSVPVPGPVCVLDQSQNRYEVRTDSELQCGCKIGMGSGSVLGLGIVPRSVWGQEQFLDWYEFRNSSELV